MAQGRDQQGTGRHPHKSSEEPYPHTKDEGATHGRSHSGDSQGESHGGGRDDDREGGGLAGILMLFLAPIAATLLQLGISRQREYSADATGARMVGQPYGLISALQKLGTYNQRIPTTAVSPATSALCIVKPMFGMGMGTLSSLFSTHPPLEDRIAALREMTVVPQR